MWWSYSTEEKQVCRRCGCAFASACAGRSRTHQPAEREPSKRVGEQYYRRVRYCAACVCACVRAYTQTRHAREQEHACTLARTHTGSAHDLLPQVVAVHGAGVGLDGELARKREPIRVPDYDNVVGAADEVKGLPEPIPDAANLRASGQRGRAAAAGGGRGRACEGGPPSVQTRASRWGAPRRGAAAAGRGLRRPARPPRCAPARAAKHAPRRPTRPAAAPHRGRTCLRGSICTTPPPP